MNQIIKKSLICSTSLMLFGAVAMVLPACSSDNDTAYVGTPTAYLHFAGNQTNLSIDAEQTAPILVEIKLSQASNVAQTFNLALSGEGAPDLTLISNSVTVKAGELTATVEIKPNVRIQTEANPRTATLMIASQAGSSYKTDATRLTIQIQPAKVYQLTADQKKLIEDYKTNLGIDLSRVLGSHICRGSVAWSGYGDYSDSYAPSLGQAKTYDLQDQVMVVTLSPKATATQPILCFAYNAFGLNNLMNTIWRGYTIDSDKMWMQTPNAPEILKAIAWTKTSMENFNVVLDNVRLSTTDKTTLTILDDYRTAIPADYPYEVEVLEEDKSNERLVVPFSFESSVWSRIISKAKADAVFKDLVVASDMDMYEKMLNLSVAKNELEGDVATTAYAVPKASVNLSTGEIAATFPFYVENGAAYNVVKVTAKPRSAK